MHAVNNNSQRKEEFRESCDQIFKDFKLNIICANRKEGFLAIIFAFAGYNTGIAFAFRSSLADISTAIWGILGVTNIPETREE